MSYQAPKGTFDIAPYRDKTNWQSSAAWNYVEEKIRSLAVIYGYKELRTPIFERAEVFLRNVGETSDIVSKEMYLFEDKANRMMALRPEGTAAAMRAFIEHRLDNEIAEKKFFYIAPMFRYDRPQAGRYRQHHQFGVEAIGSKSEAQDAEIISLLYNLLKGLGLTNLSIELNSIGTKEDRDRFKGVLKEYLQDHLSSLSDDSQIRLEQNPLRILDSKDPKDKEIVQGAPSILDFLSPESKKSFEKLQALLTLAKIPFNINPLLVRGLDYYNETVFEVVTTDLGAQNSLGGGGRYDGLLKTMGGPDLPAIGFGAGIERIIQTMIKQGAPLPEAAGPMLYIIPLGEGSLEASFSLLQNARKEGVSSSIDFSGKKLGKGMQNANAAKARYTAVIGDTEVASGIVGLKEMETGEEFPLSFSAIPSTLSILTRSEKYLPEWEALEAPFSSQEQAQFFTRHINKTLLKTQETTSKLSERLEELKQFLEEPNEL